MPVSRTYATHELTASRDGLTIYGQLVVPLDVPIDRRLPVLVCAHGFGANYLSCIPYGWELAKQGYATYCFDFCGGGYASRSNGNPLEMTVETERDDIAAVVSMLRAHPGIDPSRIALMGEDQGGLAAVLFANQLPSATSALILVSATFNQHDLARRLFPTKKNIPVSYRHLGMRVGRAYGESAWDINPYEHMRSYTQNVLLVHGDEDTNVPLEYAQRAAAVYPHAHLQTIRGGRHAFRGETQQQAIAFVAEFLSASV